MLFMVTFRRAYGPAVSLLFFPSILNIFEFYTQNDVYKTSDVSRNGIHARSGMVLEHRNESVRLRIKPPKAMTEKLVMK